MDPEMARIDQRSMKKNKIQSQSLDVIKYFYLINEVMDADM
jgi:hypothetical protein